MERDAGGCLGVTFEGDGDGIALRRGVGGHVDCGNLKLKDRSGGMAEGGFDCVRMMPLRRKHKKEEGVGTKSEDDPQLV